MDWSPQNRCILLIFVGQNRRINDRLGVAHLMKAFRWILLETQRTSFPDEINALRNREPPASNSRALRQGLLRSRGRLSKAKYLLVSRYPIILDSKHPPVKLFLLHIHKSNSHASFEQSRSLVQEQFWVLRCRSALKTIIHHCIPCRRITQHVDYPIMADLPDCHLPSANHFPFLTSGLDFVLPFPIKDNGQFERRYCFYLIALSQELFISKLVLILLQIQPSCQYVVSFLCVETHKSSLAM